MSREKVLITPIEAMRCRRHHTQEMLSFAKSMADIYCARPLRGDATNFYTFVADVFHAGRISGVREMRRRRKTE